VIRAYNRSDKIEVIQLFKLNTPQYFDASEEKGFVHYLDHDIEDYFVFESNRQIIGSGGVNLSSKEKSACLSYGMIHPDFQGQGIGRELTHFRINHLRRIPHIEEIVVRTSQHVFKFYEKMGFKIDHIEKDYWAKDFDLYQMKI
jgi:ribosomal protein S18 acetylase RimI-like enzyme